MMMGNRTHARGLSCCASQPYWSHLVVLDWENSAHLYLASNNRHNLVESRENELLLHEYSNLLPKTCDKTGFTVIGAVIMH